MARNKYMTPVLAACMIAVASPLASATSQNDEAQAATNIQTSPAQNVNMLSMELCGERDRLIDELHQVYDETPMAVGQVDSNAVVEIFASSGGTWTIIATGTDGVSCVVSAGEGYESIERIPGVDA